PERFTYQGADDWPVEGWVMRPVEFRDGARYPTVLQIHGGPHGAYGEAFFHEFQLLAAEGFAVVYTNPRGSQGYGQQFTAATHHDWGGKDCEDILRGLDQAIARFPNESHELSRIVRARHRVERLHWIVQWLADHLRQPAAAVVREPAVAGGTE